MLVFFFLPGFVIIEAVDLLYFNRPVEFLVNRMLRIAPLFLVALIVSFAALYVLDRCIGASDEAGRPISAAFTAPNIVANLLTIFPVPGRFSLIPSVNILRIAWALRTEMAFYISLASQPQMNNLSANAIIGDAASPDGATRHRGPRQPPVWRGPPRC